MNKKETHNITDWKNSLYDLENNFKEAVLMLSAN